MVTGILTGVIFLSYAAVFQMTPESYPTEIRSTAQGLFFFISRIGGVTAPILAGIILDLEGGQQIAIGLFGIGYLIAGVASLMLTETRSQENLINT